MNLIKACSLFFFISFICSCNKISPVQQDESPENKNTATNNLSARTQAAASATISENFESGTKTAYTAANVILASGVWNFSDALIGNSSSDRKNGAQSARVRNSGKLTMQFDNVNGTSTVTVLHALYGTDASCSWQLWYSINGGAAYAQAGSTITTTSTTLTMASFTLNIAGNIRFEIRKT